MKTKRVINKKEQVDVMKKGTIVILLICTLIFSITLVQAIEIKPVKQGETALLYQTCNNCTYCNITSVRNEEGNLLLSNREFEADGTDYSINLTGGNTTTLGEYTYCYDCGNSVDSETGCINFNVTPSGRDGNDNIALFIILLVMIYAVAFISFFGRNVPLSILTGMMLSFTGLWIIRNGIVIYRDNLTLYFGYATIFIGALIALWATLEWIEDIL